MACRCNAYPVMEECSTYYYQKQSSTIIQTEDTGTDAAEVAYFKCNELQTSKALVFRQIMTTDEQTARLTDAVRPDLVNPRTLI